jgi:hypothetical protein
LNLNNFELLISLVISLLIVSSRRRIISVLLLGRWRLEGGGIESVAEMGLSVHELPARLDNTRVTEQLYFHLWPHLSAARQELVFVSILSRAKN